MTKLPGHQPGRMRSWIVALFLLAAVIPVGALGLYAQREAARAIHALVDAGNDSLAAVTAELLQRNIEHNLGLAQTFANLPRTMSLARRHDAAAMREQLRILVDNNRYVDRAFVADHDGTLWSDYPLAPESIGKNFSHRDWYRGVTRNWQPYVSEVYRRHAEPKPVVVAITVPVIDKDDRLGILVYQIQLQGLTRWLSRLGVDGRSHVFMIDHKGTLAAHPSLLDNPRRDESYAGLDAIQTAMRGTAVSTRYVDPVTGQDVVASIRPLSFAHQRWLIVASQPVDEAYAPVYAIAWRIGIAGVIVALAALAVVVRLVWMNSRNRQLNTELQARNHQLETMTQELGYLNDELDAFNYSVSHDLRAPLRAITGFGQALVDNLGDSLDERNRGYLSRVHRAAQRMERLIDDLLMLSRLSRTALTKERVDLSRMAHEIIAELQHNEPERKVTVVIEPGIEAYGDAGLLRAAMDNLLGNAWKFTGNCAQPRIEFGREQQQGDNVYFVRDNGAGFEMDYADKIFNAFERLHDESEFPGTGIGLATVQRIIHRHGGCIWAHGSPNEGATVYFTLAEIA